MTVASTTQVDKVVDSRFTLLKLWRIVAQFAEYDLMGGGGNATASFAPQDEAVSNPAGKFLSPRDCLRYKGWAY